MTTEERWWQKNPGWAGEATGGWAGEASGWGDSLPFWGGDMQWTGSHLHHTRENRQGHVFRMSQD